MADVGVPQTDAPARSRLARLAMSVLWPSFLMAGVLEMLTFAVVDPRSLHWFGGPPIEWPPLAVYTVTFFIFWGVIAAGSALTQLLGAPAQQINEPSA
jgi:hypothetical protein